jgi:hypothetical protein
MPARRAASPRPATLADMPVPSKRAKELTEGTVDHHASLSHPDLQEITIRWRGSFGYIAAWAGEGDDDDEKIPLCRIEYLGDDDWAFALYDPATEDYRESTLSNGQYTGQAVDAYDTAALVHLADYKK